MGPLLAKGVTATMGCVWEPYITGTPDISLFTVRWGFNGFSFGEAAWSSQPVLSWQTTVVGDPLYRPFVRNPEQLHDDLQHAKSPYLAWSFLRLVDTNLAAKKPQAECTAFLEQLGLARQSAILTEKLGDLYTAQGKPASAVHEYELALKLEPTPLQRVRLRLELGEKLAALGRESEAYDHYQHLLTECPDYPDKAGLYRKLLPLAQKLDKKQDVETYEAELNRLTPPTQAKP